MSTKVETKEYHFDPVKWLVAVALILGGAVAFSYFKDQYDLIYRVLAVTAIIGIAIFVAANTAKGAAFWALLKAAQVEVRKVVWPSRQEVNQTTVIVVVIVLIAALILWCFDFGIGWVASRVIA